MLQILIKVIKRLGDYITTIAFGRYQKASIHYLPFATSRFYPIIRKKTIEGET